MAMLGGMLANLRRLTFVQSTTNSLLKNSVNSVFGTSGVVTQHASQLNGAPSPAIYSLLDFTRSLKITPRFTGGKLKPYSAFKYRFKTTANGLIRYRRPGYVHKKFNKGNSQLSALGKAKNMHDAYAKTMKRLGFR